MNTNPVDLIPPTQAIASLLEALSSAPRLEILLKIGSGEACVCHLEAGLGLRQAYISQQLMTLREADLITSRREGRYIFYRLKEQKLLEFIQFAAQLAGAAPIFSADSSSPRTFCGCPHCDSQNTATTKEEVPIYEQQLEPLG